MGMGSGNYTTGIVLNRFIGVEKHMVAKTREQGDEPGRGGIHALQSLERHLEPGGPDSLGGPP